MTLDHQKYGRTAFQDLPRQPYMDNQLPEGLEQLVQAKVQSNRFKFSDRAITAAGRLRWLPFPL
jgi:hypothetical protein